MISSETKEMDLPASEDVEAIGDHEKKMNERRWLLQWCFPEREVSGWKQES